MINNGTLSQRNVGAIVLIDGAQILWESISVTNKNFYFSDTYNIVFPLYNNPGFDFDYWGNLQQAEIQIYMGFPNFLANFTTADLTLLFTGGIDVIDLDPIAGTVTITGRDYSYLLIDQKINQTYINQTSSQIATLFATQNGLTPVVTATSTPVGVYNNSYTLVSNNVTEWDYLTYLAQQEDFNLYVENKELHFEPKPTASTPAYVISLALPTATTPYPVGAVESIKFGRTLTLAQDVIVKVRSNSLISGVSFAQSAESQHIKGSLHELKQTYTYTFPNLTPQQAAAKAEQLLQQITQHELLLNVTLPGNVTLNKITPIQISGTNSVFDQVFYTDSITRTLSAEDGFRMSIEAKNHNTNTEVIS